MICTIDQFHKVVDENNRACEMALRYAAMILSDFRDLSREGRKLMAEKLMEMISVDVKPWYL